MALVLELLHRGYRVCLSMCSPHVRDVVWALQTLKRHRGTDADVLRLFGLPSNPNTRKMAASALGKDIRVNYFKPGAGAVDVCSPDPGAASADTAGWGGLAEFSANVGAVVDALLATRWTSRGSRAATTCTSAPPTPTPGCSRRAWATSRACATWPTSSWRTATGGWWDAHHA